MTISTKVFVEHPDLALVPTIRSTENVDVDVVSDAGTDPQHGVHFFRFATADFEALERALDADYTVASFAQVARTDERRTYRVEYSDDAKLVTPAVTDVGGLVVESHSHDTGWVLELELQDNETLYDIDAFAREEGIQFDVLELHQSADVDADTEFRLTEPQIEALVSAYLNGYYDEPRDISLEGLSELLGISQTAVSGRLRRGSARLIEETLVEPDEDEE